MATEITAVSAVLNRQVAATTSSARPDVTLASSQVSGNASSTARSEGEGRVVGTTNPPNEEAVNQAVVELNDFVQNIERNLEFSIDRNNGNTVISVIDPQTDEVIRQIPPERALDAVRNLERLEGLLLSAEA